MSTWALLERVGDLELVARTVVHGFLAGQHRAPYRGAGHDFFGHRAYQQGDETRRIDWRLYGRSDRLFVREYREHMNLHAYLVVDASLSMDYADPDGITKLRFAQVLAGALAHIMLAAGDAVGLASYGRAPRMHVPARSRRGHLHDLLLELERLRPAGGSSAARTLELVGGVTPRRGRIVLISDMLDDDDGAATIASLALLRARGDEVIVLRPLTRTEEGLQPLPAGAYFDPETPERTIAGSPVGYRDRIAAYYDDVGQRLRGREIEYVPLSTAVPVERALRAWLAARRA